MMMILCVCLSLLVALGSVGAKQFRDPSYSQMSEWGSELEGAFAEVRAADQLWGNEGLKGAECSAQVIRVTDVDRLEPQTHSHTQSPRSRSSASASSAYRPLRKSELSLPQVVISGEIHGNERVGPLASLFTAQLLVWSSMCSIKRSISHCTHLKEALLISDEEITWLTHIATRRDTYILPAPNCHGYIHKVRSDEGIDTNRDFSYSRKDNECFMSTTAKVFQALFSTVSVQILVTFHGGMVALGYEWGSMDHPRGRDASPDDRVHSEIADSMAKFGGSFKGAPAYRAKPINSIVYPVYGGMEDWAYAAGWDTKRVRRDCKGQNLPNSDIIPNNRAVTFLVETSDRKMPQASALGYDTSVLNNEVVSNEKYGGHVPRNTRLALAAIDLVEPYVCFNGVKTTQSSSDATSRERGAIRVQWYVGGAVTVDQTWLAWHRSPPTQQRHDTDPVDRDSKVIAMASEVLTGQARWGVSDPLAMNVKQEGQFVATVVPPPTHLTKSEGGGSLWLVAHAVVDQKWGSPGQGYPHDLGPQSHLVQMRTNASYRASAFSSFDPDDVKLRGRVEWLSDAIEVEVQGSVGVRGEGGEGVTPEAEARYLRGKNGKSRKNKSRKSRRSRDGVDSDVVSSSASDGNDRSGRTIVIKSVVNHCAWWARQ